VIERVAKVLAVIVGAIILYVGAQYAGAAWKARRPADMPANSVWIDAPALPFVYYHGWWFGCWIDRDGKSNRCRLWGGGLQQPVVYEGLYVSCDTKLSVPVNELQLIPPKDTMEMWVGGSGISAPIALLSNGKVLRPVEVPDGCEQYQKLIHR
jgi:hypothetical protein